jgi:hypothetical protein
LINIYYRKIRGESPKIGEYFYEYNNADVSMGIVFFPPFLNFLTKQGSYSKIKSLPLKAGVAQ